jgi:hypothetical protein
MKVEHFIFFGTLLGIVRDGDIIPNDDDIDIYVDIKYRSKLIKELSNAGFFVNENIYPNFSNYFLQLQIPREDLITYVDFYFFDSSQAKYISEKWNFSGRIDNFYNEMHIPKELIFPLKKFLYKDIQLSIPSKPNEVCAFLYGNEWRIPLNKNKHYTTAIINNKPVILKGLLGKSFLKFLNFFQLIKKKLGKRILLRK